MEKGNRFRSLVSTFALLGLRIALVLMLPLALLATSGAPKAHARKAPAPAPAPEPTPPSPPRCPSRFDLLAEYSRRHPEWEMYAVPGCGTEWLYVARHPAHPPASASTLDGLRVMVEAIETEPPPSLVRPYC